MTWATAVLDEVALSVRNGVFARRPTDEPTGSRILRISAVRAGRVNLDDSRFVEGLDPDQIERFSINEGDLLITRYNGSRALVGTAGIVPDHEGHAIHPDKLIRVVIDNNLADPRFVNYQFQSPQVRAHLEPRIRTTAGQSGIAGADVRSIPLVLPPLDKQRRIVDVLEDHLSRLEAANDYIRAARKRLKVLVKATLVDLIPDQAGYPDSWKCVTVADAGTVGLGRQRHPDWHSGPHMKPYLRVANVFEDRIDTSDVMEMHWADGTFERFKLQPGDILLNEGQTPDLLGRPAIYRGDPPEVAFTNSLLRFKVKDGVLPEFALLVFRRHMHAGRFKRESRITTNIAHLSASRLKPVEFPIPPVHDQERIMSTAAERLDAVKVLEASIMRSEHHTAALRRSLLAAAFSGRLTGDCRADDRAQEAAG